MKSPTFIPFSLPSISEDEINEVAATLRSGWLTTGPRTSEFEEAFAQYVGTPFALAVNSGTAALHLALAALELTTSDEVITTPLTFCSTINAILQAGATPVLADVGPDGNIDPESIAERLTENTRAVVPVHLGGLPCKMEAIWSLARSHGLFVLEDAAHAIGSRYHDLPIGAGDSDSLARSDAVAFSFYATKNLTTGEGGMLTTCHEPLAEITRVLCLHGISKDAWNRYSEKGNWYYEVTACGFKYNLSDIQSAIGIHQLRKQEHFVEVRASYADLYNRAFADLEQVELPPDDPSCRHSWHLYGLRLHLDQLDIDRDGFIAELRQRKIGASVHFIPVPLHPYFACLAKRPDNHCPRALELYPRLVSLPLYPSMTEDQLRHVVGAVKEIIHAYKKKKIVPRVCRA